MLAAQDAEDHLPPLAFEPALAGIVQAGLVDARPIENGPASAELQQEIEQLRRTLRETYAGRAPSSIAGLEAARTLYRAFGIDPTRTRPSSEALLRRTLDEQKSWPWISAAVDLANLCALRFLLPIGLYDAERIEGDVVLRRGLPGESYRGVRKDEVHLEGRPVLADSRGAFGNPTADSMRTAVSEGTRALWMVVFAPGSYARGALEGHLAFAVEAIGRHLAPGGRASAVTCSVEV